MKKMTDEILGQCIEFVKRVVDPGSPIKLEAAEFLSVLEEVQDTRRILAGLPEDAIAGGWTAAGMSAYARRLEVRIAELEARPTTPERERVRREHAEWSTATFGRVGPVGPLKHLSKEAIEAVAAPGDLSEWADMQFLLWDAQRRAGISDEQITQAMVEKLEVNKQRQWPESKDREPCYHIKTTKGRPEKIGGFDWVDWNELSRRGLLERINREILHPIGLAVFRDPNTGQSGGALISPDGVWEYGRAGLYFATPSVLAAAISAVRCYDEMSTELIAEEMFKNGGAVC